MPAKEARAVVTEIHARRRLHHLTDGDIRVPVTAIALADSSGGTASLDVHVYRTSGSGSDPTNGLDPFLQEWIVARGDVELYAARPAHPADDGRPTRRGTVAQQWRGARRQPLHARSGRTVTQLPGRAS